MKAPEKILAKVSELSRLCEQYPEQVPAPEVADFLGMTREKFREMCEEGKFPFAAANHGTKVVERRRGAAYETETRLYVYISAARLWAWYTEGLEI